MDKRIINFNPGPAALPEPVLQRARDEMLDWAGTGMSVLECSHRSKEFEALLHGAKARLTELLGIPDGYQVLFVGGGATLQFAMVPLNLCPPDGTASYVVTGSWAKKAYQEAGKVGRKAVIAATTETKEKTFHRIPKPAEIKVEGDPAYVHLCSNNTIFGTQWQQYPDLGKHVMIGDFSSDFMSRRMDVSKFGLIYAGAQKNVGPAGVTVVVGRKELLALEQPNLPTYLRYKIHAENDSLYNTPPVFGIYMVALVLDWIKEQGGLVALERRNDEKGQILYGAIDGSGGFYRGAADQDSRSLMNVTYRLPTEELEAAFVADAKKAGMVGLKGHRSVGGVRASTYNAVSVEHVKTLVAFMKEFQRTKG
ncbi:MAG: 3-phosphoserine/phosphohydroxythreonine transaminase [Deltaproteobacteria bacterium]|nr:3-phosphoserine/phosphohydroxythreonine transaminase [Deltaproteobacteria bacterium]